MKQVISCKLTPIEVKILDSTIFALRELNFKIDGKTINRNVFIVDAIKASICKVLPLIKSEVKNVKKA